MSKSKHLIIPSILIIFLLLSTSCGINYKNDEQGIGVAPDTTVRSEDGNFNIYINHDERRGIFLRVEDREGLIIDTLISKKDLLYDQEEKSDDYVLTYWAFVANAEGSLPKVRVSYCVIDTDGCIVSDLTLQNNGSISLEEIFL